MSRKWIEREGPRWVEAGIVTPEQVRSIAGLYDDKSRAVALLPLLGGILLGAGILSFIAANWASIPALARLVMIIAAMLGFYGAGERVLRQGHDLTGIALIGLGWVCFGGGIILLGQTFHLMSYGAGSLILWGAAGLALAYVYASRYLLLLALAACHIAQAYSLGEFETFSYAAALLIVAAGWLAYKRGDAPLLLLVSLSAAAQSLLWVASGELRFLWMLVPLFVLYAAGDWLSDRELGIALQSGALVSAFLFAAWAVLLAGDTWLFRNSEWLRPEPWPYIAALAALLAVSVWGKYRQGRTAEAADWVIAVPFVYLPTGMEVLYMIALFVFSLQLLWRGYAEEWRAKINWGTVLFLLSTLVAYGKLTWDFMDKSLFFILGGVLMLTLGWYLNRKRSQFLKDHKGGDRP